MKAKKMLACILLVCVVSGCASIKGATVKERQDYVKNMRDATLSALFESKPFAKEQIKNAAGYGVFSDIGTNVFLLSTGSGFGVVRRTNDKKDFYMKMASVGFGMGLGIKDYRAIIIFRDQDDLDTFLEEGWEFKGQADLAAKSGEKGLAGSAAVIADMDIVTYQITEAGIAVQATLQGTKYWKDRDLNN